jgi:hypothetical protein
MFLRAHDELLTKRGSAYEGRQTGHGFSTGSREGLIEQKR